ncbi:MAG: hypothetical protein OEZ34_05850, partial [Spirochaetia bacterium]|nr:hypothetical protein [Spirochaetia bacterium]
MKYKVPAAGICFSAVVLMPGLTGTFCVCPSSLIAQPFQSYEDEARNSVEEYAAQAYTLSDEEGWRSFILSGIADERTRWTAESDELLQKKISQIESSGDENKFQTDLLRAEYETALRAWEMDAENHFLTEKGRFLARKNAMNTVSVDEGVYKSLIAQARAAVSGVLELNLDLWDETVNFLHKKIDETFETSLSDEMERVRNHSRPITAAEYKSFESELKKRELEIRSEFILLDRFYMVRARNQYITGKRIDGESLRNQAAEAEAERIGEQILTEASAEIKKNTELLLNETEVFVQNEAETGSFGISGSETSWQEKIEDIIDEGMKQWSLAEEKMLASRLAWMQARKKSRQEGSEIWKDNEAKLIQAMEDWLGEIRKNILAGRSLWDRKLMDFSKEKENAEKNLFNYIKQEKAKWHSFSGELDGMVEGGGSALLQAKDSYRFYAEVMAAEGWLSGNSVSCPEYGDGEKLCAFYNSERKKLSASISVFESILNEAEGILHSALYSDNSAGGLLTDRRSYAGDLPSVIAGMDSENFLSELTLVMEKRDESFLLYKRDLDDLIISNRYFVKRALEIRDSPGFDFKNASSREELEKIIKSLGSEYDFQKKEMLERIAELPGQLPADTEELIARIDEWFSDSVDENLRLHRKVQNYFFEGLDGYYIRKNENDPYLLTEAEYDREILRRERNRLAARLRQTETVKRYADLAAEYNAGIEIARVTMERAEIEHVRMKIRESAYKILTGDLSVDPSARTNSEIRSSELQRILELNGISKERILNKNKFIKREMEILERAMEGRTVYSGEKIDAIISEINSLSDQNSETLLGGIRTALLDHKKILKENSDKSVIENSWKHIGGLSGFLLDELKILRQEYDLEGLAGEIFDLENLMTRISLDEVRHEIDLLERSLRSGADQIKAAMEEFETAKLNYDQAVRDFNIVQSKDSASIIRIEFENISRQLSGVMKRMFQIETIPGFENAFFDSVDKERLEYLYSVSENQKAETLKEKSSQILSIITNLENSRKKNQYLELILSETDLEGLHEAALADLFQKINSVNVNEEIHPDQFSLEKYDADSVSFYSDNAANALVSEKIDLLKKEKQLNEKLSTENADSTAIEILRQEISDHKIQIIKNAELLIASNRGEEIFWSKLLLQSLEPVEGVSVLPDEETLLMSAEKLEEKAFRTSEILADAVRKFLSENNNSSEPSFSHLLKVLNDKIEVLNQVPDTNLPGFGSVHEISEKEVLSFVRSWIVLNRKQIETAGEIANSDNPFAPNEKWISLLEEANKLRDNSIFFRKFSENIPDSPDHPWVHTYREERRLLIKKLDRILQEQPSSVYSAYLSLASEDRDLMRRYGNVETIRPDISLKKIRHNLEISSAYAAVSWKEAYRKEVVFQNKKIIRRLLPRLESKKSDLNSLISEKAALALELKTALSGSGRESELKIILEEISLRINALLPELKELERQFQKSENYIKESLHPGSTSLLYGYALSLLAAEKQGLEMQQKAHQFFRQKSLIQKEKAQKTDPKEFLMGILGIYKTGPEGNLLMDFRGRPVLSETFYELFSDLDEAQDSAFYFKRILKESSASRLETWMKLLDDWFLDPRRQNIPEELKAAKALLETAFQNYISAKEIIRLARNTDFDSRLILEHALNRQNHAEQQMEKHSSLMNLENRLMESFETAAKDGRLTAENLLSLLINPENFISFYNLRNEVLPESEDKDADEGFRMKIQELQTLTKRLRDSVMEKKLADALGKYSAGLNSGFILKNEDAQPDAEKYFDELSGMSAQKIYSDLDAMSRENFRNSVMNWLKTASVLNPVYADEIMSVLKDDLSDGHELYLKIKSAVEDSELRMKKEFILFA